MKNRKYKNLLKSDNKLKLSNILKLNENFNIPKGFEIEETLMGLNLFIDDKELFEGDLLEVNYVEASSNVFEKMKERGDDKIYLYLLPSEFNFTYGEFNDVKYPTGIEDITRFLRYLITKNCVKVVGNYYINNDFVKNVEKSEEYYNTLKIPKEKEIIQSDKEFQTELHNFFKDEFKYMFEEIILLDCKYKGFTVEKIEHFEYKDYYNYFYMTLNLDINCDSINGNSKELNKKLEERIADIDYIKKLYGKLRIPYSHKKFCTINKNEKTLKIPVYIYC